MTTPSAAFAAVANALSGVDPHDEEAVITFYRRQFVSYPPQVRALISDFLIGHVGLPTDDSLSALALEIARPTVELPELDLPEWDPAYGADMEYSERTVVDFGQPVHVAVG